MSIELRLLLPDDAAVLDRVAPDVFDHAVDPHWTREFLDDARHHLMVAIDDDGTVVGMVSAVDYVHPDKAPQLWINEVGVASSHRQRGIGRRLLDGILDVGRALGCDEAWLGAEPGNAAARRLYESAGATSEPFVLYAFPLRDAAHAAHGPADAHDGVPTLGPPAA